MQFPIEELEVPRDRVAIIETIMISYQTDPSFYNKVKSILELAGISTKDRYDLDYLVARDVLMLGEALVVDGAIINPKTFRIKLIPQGGGQIFFMDNRLATGDVKYYARRASPYDIRGTSFFHPTTLEPYDDRSDHDIAAHLLLILEK